MADVIDVNLASAMFLSRRALDYLRPGGALIQMASLAGKVPFGGQAAYCASKAGLRAFSRALYEEMAPRNIHVLCVNPGPVDTDFFGDISKASDLTFSQPMSTPAEVAEATLRGLELRLPEVDIPFASGKLATLGYVSPGLTRILRPLLELRGARNKARYMRQKGQL
jgi:short-subunit dehydrogenase